MIQYLLPTSPQAFLSTPLLSWPGDLATGIRALDEDHQLLLSVLNHLNDAVNAGFDKHALHPLLHRLIVHTQFHFAREEKFFHQTAFPAAAQHEREHLHLLGQLHDIQAAFDASSTSTLTPQVMDFLRRWFVSHIEGSDSEYAPFLHAHALD